MAVVAVLSTARSVLVIVGGRQHADRGPLRGPADSPPLSVAIVVPAFNEAGGIAASIRSLAASDYPPFEIVVVDDGSTDATTAVVEGLQLGNVRLLRRPNAGKSMAVNAGIASSDSEVVVTVDADTQFEAATLSNLVEPFADETVGAVAGNTKVGNADTRLGRWQRLEYVSGFNADRRVYEVLGFLPTVPGAVGAFRRRALDQVGWLSVDTVAEDTDVTMAIGRAGWRVVYEDRAVAWTEVPSTLRALWRQRCRWTFGSLQSIWKHRGAWWHAAPVSRRGLAYMLANIVVLPMLAPVIDLFALSGIVVGDRNRLVAWIALTLLQLALVTVTLRLDGEELHGLWALPIQGVVFRALASAVLLRSSAAVALRRPVRWHGPECRAGDGNWRWWTYRCGPRRRAWSGPLADASSPLRRNSPP